MLVDADYLGTNFGNLWVLLKSLKALTADLLGIMLNFFSWLSSTFLFTRFDAGHFVNLRDFKKAKSFKAEGRCWF